jgi:hypothetical protein
MVVAQEALFRGIRLGERQVAAEMKPSRTPRCDELVGVRPAVEGDAKGIAAEDAEVLRGCGRDSMAGGLTVNSQRLGRDS